MKNSGYQKIKCTVDTCTHNFIDDCSCKLDGINVCPCVTLKKTGKDEEESACASFEPSKIRKSESL